MENDKIIFKKDKKDNTDYFSIIACVIIILLLTVQIAVNKHISKAGKAFVEGEKAKRVAQFEKQRKAKMEQRLQGKRLAKMQEEQAYQATLEDKMKRQEGQILTKSQQGMDYQQKLAIYNKSRKNIKQK